MPYHAMEVLLHLHPLDVFTQQTEVVWIAHRLRAVGCWAGPAAEGHRSILETKVARNITLLMSSGVLIPVYELGRGVVVWDMRLQHRLPRQVAGSVWYTNFSRTESGTGVGVWGLGAHDTVFQGKMFSIMLTTRACGGRV